MTKISIIIPCYNEEDGIFYLYEKLQPCLNKLNKTYQVELIFVDDGSTDKTNELLHKYYGDEKKTLILKHNKNMNLGAAVRTGFQHATGDIICTIDSDSSYDPIILVGMIDKVGPNTDMVSASPFHPQGKFRGYIPSYRLFLSKAIVLIYNLILRKKQYSYTGLTRVYKKELIENIHFKSNNFLAMAEIMIKAILKNYQVYEYPADYTFRIYGVSKIRLFGVIKAHFFFVLKLLNHKIFKTNI